MDSELPAAAYVDQLLNDLSNTLMDEPRRSITSVFIGGGTPSLFPAEAIQRLLDGVGEQLDLCGAEITMEANPGTFDASNFTGYFQAGVNRLSLGGQSFSNDSLEALGRIHKAGETQTSFAGARQAGFDRINIDLMHGLPGQTSPEAVHDLEQAIALGVDHISWYQLTIEPNTIFYHENPTLPADSILANIETQGRQRLHHAGFEQYEISAWAKGDDQISLHNLNYWTFGDYIGIGAGAHGKLTREDGIYRTTRTRIPVDYLRDPNARAEQVASEDILLEYLMNALRLTRGFALADFEHRTGLARSALASFLDKAMEQDFIEPGSDFEVVPTRRGQVFLNNLLMLAS